MIVDMERMIYLEFVVGSVKLSKQKIVEEYKDFHYVSLIKGKLKKY